MNQRVVTMKSKMFNRYKNIAEKLIRLFPDWITGKSEVMQQKYYRRYGSRDYRWLIHQNKMRIMTAYLGILTVFILFSICIFLDQFMNTKEIRSIERPGYGDASKVIPVEVHMKYKDHELAKNITIRVKPKELSEKEKREQLRVFKNNLTKLILGENEDIDHVSKPLFLPDRDPDSGITIHWTSDHPEIVSEDGEVNLINGADPETIMLQAELTLDDLTAAAICRVKIDQDAAAEDYKRNMTGRLEDRLVQLSRDRNSDDLALPEELGNGITARWFSGKEKSGVILLSALFLAILTVFFKRYDQINKEIREAEESILKDLPEFINKLVLLLNAGLVVSTAFTKIVCDYEAFHKKEKQIKHREKRFLYEELSEIQKRVSQSNASLIRELREFSQRCGVREMVRLTAVITDNWNKGSTLAEKLEGESELLWINRKKRAEEKGKLAETKLTFPLMILLIVLIMVTIAPAMLEM